MSSRFWVNKDYINELTVFLALATALIPWNIQYITLPELGRLVFIRFPFFQIRYQLGFKIGNQNLLLSPYGAYNYQAGNPMAEPYQYWLIAAVPLAAAVLTGVAMYLVDQDNTPASLDALQEKLPIPLARLVGGFLALGTALLAGATYLLFTTGFLGINIPVGLALIGLFAYILLTNPVVEK